MHGCALTVLAPVCTLRIPQIRTAVRHTFTAECFPPALGYELFLDRQQAWEAFVKQAEKTYQSSRTGGGYHHWSTQVIARISLIQQAYIARQHQAAVDAVLTFD